jgi:hypothetical protein
MSQTNDKSLYESMFNWNMINVFRPAYGRAEAAHLHNKWEVNILDGRIFERIGQNIRFVSTSLARYVWKN